MTRAAGHNREPSVEEPIDFLTLQTDFTKNPTDYSAQGASQDFFQMNERSLVLLFPRVSKGYPHNYCQFRKIWKQVKMGPRLEVR